MLKNRLIKPLAVVISSLGIISSSHSMEQIGSGSATDPIGHYGLNATAKSGLKSVIPKGWQLYAHKKLTLPETVSWKSEDTFMQALEKIEAEHQLIITVDWDKKAVYLRKNEITEVQVAPPTVAPVPQRAATLEVPPAEVPGLNTKPADYVPKVNQDKVATQPSPKSIVAEYAVSPGYAKKIAEEAMTVVGYELLWDAPPLLRTDHAITLFRNAETDIKLILDAMGGTMSGLMAYISEDSKQVKVVFADLKSDMGKTYKLGGALFPAGTSSKVAGSRTTPTTPISSTILASANAETEIAGWKPAESRPFKPEVGNSPESKANSKPSAEIPVVPAVTTSSVTSGQVSDPAIITQQGVLTLVVEKHGRFEEALEDFLKKEGFRLKWAGPSGLEANSEMLFKAPDVKGMLNKLLPRLRLQAEILYDGEQKTVVVLPADDIAIR